MIADIIPWVDLTASQGQGSSGSPSNQSFSAHARPLSKGHISNSLAEVSNLPTAQMNEQHRVLRDFADTLASLNFWCSHILKRSLRLIASFAIPNALFEDSDKTALAQTVLIFPGRSYPMVQYSRTSMARTPLGPWKFVRDMGSSSHWGLILAPVQEANNDNLGKSFRVSTQWLYVVCTH